MNYGKRGRPFIYPEPFIQFADMAYTFFHLPYRQLEGLINQLSHYVPGLKLDYTDSFMDSTIKKRRLKDTCNNKNQ